MKEETISQFKILTREDKGKRISKNPNIVKTTKGWRIPSETNPNKKYFVKFIKKKLTCDCYDYCNKKNKCKHVYAIEIARYKAVKRVRGGKRKVTKETRKSKPVDYGF